MDLDIAQLLVTQNSLRKKKKDLRQMAEFAKRNFFNSESLHRKDPSSTSLIKISTFSDDDDNSYIHDGHHRCCAILLSGRTYLRADEFTLTDWKVFSKYEEINFEKGWITPFNPKFELRIANTDKFHKTVAFLDREEATAFIRENKNLYCVQRNGHTLKTLSDARHLPGATNSLIYSNLKLYSPDGVLLTRMSQKKFNWYLRKNLAIQIDKDAIQLSFNPKNNIVNDYYTEYKENRCVVCGQTDGLTRHHIVPHEYKKHLERQYKNHNSHDILPLCIPCHTHYETLACEFRNQLFEELEIEDIKELHKKGILSKIVVEKITNVEEFCFKWREHFVETMKPLYLPKSWKIDYKVLT